MTSDFDFDRVINRRGTNSLKWNVKEKEIPLWVADMDFLAPKPILESLSKKISEGIFGYQVLDDSWAKSYISWWKRRHNFCIEKDWLVFCTGVIPAISSAVRRFSSPAEYVAVLTPVYNIFFNSIVNNGRRVKECPLLYKNGEYSIDFDSLEKTLSDPLVSLFILCNPHNPIGILWDKETLSKIGSLCAKYNVTVLSDEIHCDITEGQKSYVPFASVSEECKNISVTCVAPTKAFNLAGIQTAAVVVPNEKLRAKIERQLNTDEVAEPNAFALSATVAAFDECEAWLDAMRSYVFENRALAESFVNDSIEGISAVHGEATYLCWLDCSLLLETKNHAASSKVLAGFIRKKTGLYLSAGSVYGGNGNNFLRMNVACPKSIVQDALERLKTGTQLWKEKE